MAYKRKPVAGHYRIMADNRHVIYTTAGSPAEARAIADSIAADIELARQRYQEWLQTEEGKRSWNPRQLFSGTGEIDISA